MSLWRRVALNRFPHLHRQIADAEHIGEVWFRLYQALEGAYRQESFDESFVGAIYEYASWCLHHRNIDVRTAVVVSFYEHLPDNPVLRPDMARWMSSEDFDLVDFAWEYVLKDKKIVQDFQEEFSSRKAGISGRGEQATTK